MLSFFVRVQHNSTHLRTLGGNSTLRARTMRSSRNHDYTNLRRRLFLQGSLHPKGCISCAHVALRSLLHSFNVSFRHFAFRRSIWAVWAGVLVRSVHQHLKNSVPHCISIALPPWPASRRILCWSVVRILDRGRETTPSRIVQQQKTSYFFGIRAWVGHDSRCIIWAGTLLGIRDGMGKVGLLAYTLFSGVSGCYDSLWPLLCSGQIRMKCADGRYPSPPSAFLAAFGFCVSGFRELLSCLI
jgi:hypothetical protein